jgi:hypothetical protein
VSRFFEQTLPAAPARSLALQDTGVLTRRRPLHAALAALLTPPLTAATVVSRWRASVVWLLLLTQSWLPQVELVRPTLAIEYFVLTAS